MPGCDRADDGPRRDRRKGLLAHCTELETCGCKLGDGLVEALADERRNGAEFLAVRAPVPGCVELDQRESQPPRARRRVRQRGSRAAV